MVTTYRLISVPNRNIRNYWCQFCIYLHNTERQVILNVCFCILLLYTEITLSKRRVSVDTMIHLIFNWFETKNQLLDLPLYSSQQIKFQCQIRFLFSIPNWDPYIFGFDRKPRKSLCLCVCLSVCDNVEFFTLSKREIFRLVSSSFYRSG